MGIDLRLLHPLVLLGAKLALVFLTIPLITSALRLVIGREKDAALRNEDARPYALVLVVGAMLFGAGLGFDALDPKTLPPSIATSIPARGATALLFALLAALPMLGTVRDTRRPVRASTGARAALGIAVVLSCLPVLLLGVSRFRTALGDDPLSAGALPRAPMRAALVPTDADARLGIAFIAASSGEAARARTELAIARALGADEATGFEIESELEAREGNCATAVALFRKALEARVPSDPSELRLTLGGYHLPPSLVTRCDFASGSAR